MKKIKHWLEGLGVAILTGVASGVILIIQDPRTFNLHTGIGNLIQSAIVYGLFAGATYMIRSPFDRRRVREYRNQKQKIQSGQLIEKEKCDEIRTSPDFKDVAKIITLFLGLSFLGTGCASLPNAKITYFDVKVAVDKYEPTITTLATIATREVIKFYEKSPEKRQAIGNDMYIVSHAFYSLMTLNPKPEDLRKAIAVYAPNKENLADVADSFVGLYSVILAQYPEVTKYPQLVNQVLLALAKGVENAAKAYISV